MFIIIIFSVLVLFVVVVYSNDPVTCGSVIKLIHSDTQFHLQSHPIAYGSGSGQQSVTTMNTQSDSNSLWVVKEASSGSCELGMPVQCGDKIRLEHVRTGKNLHSHLYKAPISANQEVSGFGVTGAGDTGDNWTILCEKNKKEWFRGSKVQMLHADTNRYLHSANNLKFTPQNCGQGCPIMNQNEVSASNTRTSGADWMTGQGVYFPPKKEGENDEL